MREEHEGKNKRWQKMTEEGGGKTGGRDREVEEEDGKK